MRFLSVRLTLPALKCEAKEKKKVTNPCHDHFSKEKPTARCNDGEIEAPMNVKIEKKGNINYEHIKELNNITTEKNNGT